MESRKSSIVSSLGFSYFSIASTEACENIGLGAVLSCMKSKLRWKASLINKRNRTAAVSLSQEDVEFLVTNTSYSMEDISDWHQQFIDQCPQGSLERCKVEEMLCLILPSDSVESVSNLIFTTFDKDHNGNLNFVEFVTSLHCMSSSSPEDKLHWVFQLYDTDGSGSITLSEMVLLFATLYQNEGLDKMMAVDRAEKIFSNLDINNDGDITEEEFVRGCLKDDDMRRLLSETNSESILSGISTPNITN